MAFKPGQTWDQALNEAITRLVRFRDAVASQVEFSNVADYTQLVAGVKTQIRNKCATGTPEIIQTINDVNAYIQAN